MPIPMANTKPTQIRHLPQLPKKNTHTTMIPSTRTYNALLESLRQTLEIDPETFQQQTQQWPIDEDWLRYQIKTKHPQQAQQIIKEAQKIATQKDTTDTLKKQNNPTNIQIIQNLNQKMSTAEKWQIEEEIRDTYYGDKELKQKPNFATAINTLAKHLIQIHQIITLEETNEIYYYTKGAYKKLGEAYIKKEASKILATTNIRLSREIINAVKCRSYKNAERNKPAPELVCLKNGILNVVTKEFTTHNQQHLFFNQLPFEYDPEADCPKIKKFVKEIVTPEDLPIIQEYTGYTLLRNYKYHKALMLYGGGANGKSVFLNLIKTLVGIDNVCSISLQDLETNRFATSELHEKMVNIYPDLSPKVLEDSARFKMVTGGDLVQAERKNQHPFKFTNYAKMMFSANNLPKVKDVSPGLFRRWIIVPFPNNFEGKENFNLLDELQEEMPGFLNWAIEGLNQLLKQNKFSSSKSTQEVKRTYLRMSDPIMAFAEDHCGFNPLVITAKEDVYDAYLDYCRSNDLPAVQDNSFGRGLKRVMDVRIKEGRVTKDGMRKNAWRGLVLNTSDRDVLVFSPSLSREEKEGNSIKDRKKTHANQGTSIFTGEIIIQLLQATNTETDITHLEQALSIPDEELDQELYHLERSGDIITPKPGYVRINT